MRKIVIIVFFLFLNLYSLLSESSIYKGNFTSDWGGLRPVLSEKGFEIGSRYIFELWNVAKKAEGQESSYYIQNIDIDFVFDFEKLFGIKGGKLLFDLQGMEGENPNFRYVRSFQGISNIEAWNNFLIYEFWYQQNLFNDKLSLLVGLFDLNSEFDSKITNSNFITPAHGIGTDLGLTGRLGPSIFPVTSLALRARYTFSEDFYFSLAFFDGIPGDTNNLRGTHVVLKNTDGLLVIGEANLFREIFYNAVYAPVLKLGFWYYTNRYTHIVSDIRQWGVYAAVENNVYREKRDKSQGLNVSLRVGYSDPETNFTDVFVGLAFEYKGLIPTRGNDYVGFALAYSDLTPYFHKRFNNEVYSDHHHDLNFELFYKLHATGFLFIQPVFSYYISPAFNNIFHDYFAAGVRMYVQM